ncbi:putative NACHT-NTPase and P-loop NTPases N-terminal domain-containing protein [Seiridium cardinale]
MDPVSSVAAISQLLAQAIALWQQVELARQSVRNAPKVLENTKTQLWSLLDTIDKIKCEEALHTSSICTQLVHIQEIVAELNHLLTSMEMRQCKSTLQQNLRALGRRQRDDAKLGDVVGRLQTAKDELALRISVVHVGITRAMLQPQDERLRIEHHFKMEGNETYGESDQINGIFGFDASRVPTIAVVLNNSALGNSRQKNLILDHAGAANLFQSMLKC